MSKSIMIYILSKDKKRNFINIKYSNKYNELDYSSSRAYCAVYCVKEVDCIIID